MTLSLPADRPADPVDEPFPAAVAPSPDLSSRPPSEDLRSSPGVAVEWLLSTATVGLTRWRCLGSHRHPSEEKHQLWHVVAFVHAGAFLFESPGGSSVVDSNCLLFYNPRAPYRTAHPFGCGDRGSALAVRHDVLRDIVASHDPAASERPASLFVGDRAASSPRLYLAQRSLVRQLAAGTIPDPLAAEEQALGLVSAAVRTLYDPSMPRPARPDTAQRHRELSEAVRTILQESFRTPVTLAALAARVGVSPYHVCRIFRSATGLPIHRYLNQLRLRAALDAVDGGARDLCALALDLGFSSHSHFTLAFRREFRTTPARLRGAFSAAVEQARRAASPDGPRAGRGS